MQLIISCITGVLHRRQIRCRSNPKLNPIPNPELAYHQALRRDTSWTNGNPCASTQYLMVESSPRYCMAFSACVKHSIGCACSPCAATRPTPLAIRHGRPVNVLDCFFNQGLAVRPTCTASNLIRHTINQTLKGPRISIPKPR